MSISYIDADQLLAARFPEVKKEAEKTEIRNMVKAVSAFVDKYTDRAPGYYAAAAADPSTKRIRGEGSHFLRIPAHIPGTVSVEGVSVLSYYENEENGWLYKYSQDDLPDGAVINISDLDCYPLWTKGKVYSVAARWGFEAVPDDIAEAVAQITVRWWETQSGILGQINPAGFVIERDLPEAARILLESWIKREFEI